MDEKQKNLLSYLFYYDSFDRISEEKQRNIMDLVNLRGGSAVLHIDKDGKIKGVKIETQFRI